MGGCFIKQVLLNQEEQLQRQFIIIILSCPAWVNLLKRLNERNPHYYDTEEEIQTCLETIKSLSSKKCLLILFFINKEEKD
ncbi:MAG: hypothetical protein ACXADY_09570 [Candidatus Hodarchaeales archaeon]|jgi:guanylate kinase